MGGAMEPKVADVKGGILQANWRAADGCGYNPLPESDESHHENAMKDLEPKQAYDFLKQNPDAIFVDCRSEMEFLFVGHPTGAILVPWNDGPNWEINPDFVAHVKKAASIDRPIVIICRSGNRSVDAALALEAAGFTQVYNVLHGFEGGLDENHHRNSKTGWRHDGLPWEQC
jgi:rhodanese-related sulfurtransferase